MAAAATLLLLALTALVQPTPAAADPIDLSTTRPESTTDPEPTVSLAPDQSILATPSETASGDPTAPSDGVTAPPVETTTSTPDPTDTPSDPTSSDPSATDSQGPSSTTSSEPPASPNGSSGTSTTPPPVSPSGGSSSTTPTSGSTSTPVVPKPAPAVENVKWRNALFTAAASSSPERAPSTLAPTVNTVPVVTARPVCGGIVFANPDSAYSAAVTYGEFTKAPAKPVRLLPTTTRFVPISAARVDWAALSGDPGSGASIEVVGAAGFGESVAVPQCSRTPGEVHVMAMAPCLARGQDAVIMVNNGTGSTASSELSWRISRQGDPLVLAQGVLGRTGASSVDLSSFGVGTYTVSVLQNGKVEDHVDFAALDCVATVADCTQVMVTNPVRNPVSVTLTWRSDDSSGRRAKNAKVVELGPGRQVSVPAVAGSLQWSAISAGGKSAAASLTGDAGSDLTSVAESCATTTPTGDPTGEASVPGATDGGPTASPVGSSASGRVDPSSSVSTGGMPPVTIDPGTDVSSSAALLGGIAVGGAALVWLLAALLRRRP